MTKKGPLGKAEKFYIEEKCWTEDVRKIAKDLDRAISLVEEHANTFQAESMIAKSKFGRQAGAVVMTQTASQMGDDHRQNSKKNGQTRTNCVTTIKRPNVSPESD